MPLKCFWLGLYRHELLLRPVFRKDKKHAKRGLYYEASICSTTDDPETDAGRMQFSTKFSVNQLFGRGPFHFFFHILYIGHVTKCCSRKRTLKLV